MPTCPVGGRGCRDGNFGVGFNAIMVRFTSICTNRFFMHVVIRSNNNLVYDLTAFMSGYTMWVFYAFMSGLCRLYKQKKM